LQKLDRRKTKIVHVNGESQVMHGERREAGENKGQRPMAENVLSAEYQGTQLGNEIGNYKGLSHPVPNPKKGASLLNTQKGTNEERSNKGISLPYTNHGHVKREISTRTFIRPKAEGIQPYESGSSLVTNIRPKADQKRKEDYPLGRIQPIRASSYPSTENLGNAAWYRRNCVLDSFTGRKIAQNVRMDERRILMMKSSPDSQSRPEEDDESTGLSPKVRIAIEREAISQLITQQLRLSPGLEAASRQGHEIERCRGSSSNCFPALPPGTQNKNFYLITSFKIGGINPKF
jgi:hypothetical protein